MEHSEELLNRPAPLNPSGIEAAYTEIPIDVTPQTTKEIRLAIRQIENEETAATDNMQVRHRSNFKHAPHCLKKHEINIYDGNLIDPGSSKHHSKQRRRGSQ
ncbi:unnamed protein product [Schistosoma curassoni]|uniref:Reverse transcriptase domain-containing protein n=1 Tax=Schistosoma curassoni TaxID=6186 RepID=A0A183JIH0_9TREM|nr:unnamed protein product [Schistosoma curassoni]